MHGISLRGLAFFTIVWAALPARAQLLPEDTAVAREIAGASSARPLQLNEVLTSMALHQPQIRQALEKAREASGRRLAAQGGFDPRLTGSLQGREGGHYELMRTDIELRQPTPLWGAEFYGGYRLGLGADPERRYPTYYSDETLAGGEFRAGVEVPLWRGGPIDERRARLRGNKSLEQASESGLRNTTLRLAITASQAYYTWSASGHRLFIAERLLNLARERGTQLQAREQAGSVSQMDVLENQRMIVSREDILIQQRRDFEIRSANLALFSRDAQGRSEVPGMNRLPPLPSIGAGKHREPEAALQQIIACHPRLQQLREEREAAIAKRDFADNLVAPDIRAMFQVSRDMGDPARNVTLPGTVLEAGIKLGFPLLLRESRGGAQAASANVRAQDAQIDWVEDQLRASVRNAASRLNAGMDRVEISQRLVETSEALARGERDRYDAGASTLLIVNLREIAAADAENRYISALAEAHTALYEWQALTTLVCGSS